MIPPIPLLDEMNVIGCEITAPAGKGWITAPMGGGGGWITAPVGKGWITAPMGRGGGWITAPVG